MKGHEVHAECCWGGQGLWTKSVGFQAVNQVLKAKVDHKSNVPGGRLGIKAQGHNVVTGHPKGTEWDKTKTWVCDQASRKPGDKGEACEYHV